VESVYLQGRNCQVPHCSYKSRKVMVILGVRICEDHMKEGRCIGVRLVDGKPKATIDCKHGGW
jgi:hypothetical protein